MAPLIFVVDMGVHSPADLKRMKEDIIKIPGVVEVPVSLVTGHVAIIGWSDAATLKARLEATLCRPVFLIADLGAPPVGDRYGMLFPTSPAPISAFPAPMLVRGYHLYGPFPPPPVGAHYPPRRYMGPPPQAGNCYYTPFGGRPWGPLPRYTPYDAPADPLEDDIFLDEHHKGCCCSIQ